MAEETTIKQVEFEIERCRRTDQDGKFYGYTPFVYLWKEHRLPPFMEMIRVFSYDSHLIDPHYFTTKEGKLELIVREGDDTPITTHDPKDILSLEKAPNGWEVAGSYWCWEKKNINPF